MSDETEEAWERGNRRAWVSMLLECCRQLGVNDPVAQYARWIAEREQVVVVLRRVCGEWGDNDWPDDLHLADVIEKHLEGYLGDE